jgi:hypothetical protein
MLIFLFSLVASKKMPKIEDMNARRFRNAILEGRNIEVYVTLISNPDLEGHLAANEILENAFEIGKGFLRFAYYDSAKNPAFARKHKIREPTFVVFHAGGQLMLPAHNITARKLVNRASFMIPDFTMKITNELDESYITPICVLFTERKIAPSLWTAISYHFRNKGHLIKIGFSNNKTLAAMFNITEFPKIMMKNSSKTLIYDGINDFMTLKEMINKFVLKRLTGKVKSLTALPLKFFKKKCSKPDKICIVHTSPALSEDFLKFRKKHTTNLLQFLYGDQKLPFPWMEKDSVYGFRLSTDQYFKAENLEDLEYMIPQALIGKLKWANMEL